MEQKTGVVNVFAMPYLFLSKRNATNEESLDLVNNQGLSTIEALQVKDQLLRTISTHTEAATHMLRERKDNALEAHVDKALDSCDEYRNLLRLMPSNVPAALRSYQSEFSEDGLAFADKDIKNYGVEIAENQLLFHGGHWTSNSHFFTSSRPLSTSFCPQIALRNAEWRGKGYEAGRVELMVVRVMRPKTKAYAFSRDGDHGNEKEVVFASGAELTRVSETYIVDIPAEKCTSDFRVLNKLVPAYVVEVEIS